MKKRILIYILFVLALTLVSCFSLMEMDGVWGYGFSYNIANGMIPYKDFNMVIGPFYSIIFSFFIKIFGNYFLAYSFQHAVIYGIVFLFLYEKIGKKSIYVLLLLGCALTSFGYNTFCSILVVTILLLLESRTKYKQVFIGIIIGMILMTKHNIGLILTLVYLFNNRKNFKQVFSLLIPIIPTFIYLLFN